MLKVKIVGKYGQGKFATIDDDFLYLTKYRWYLYNGRYAARNKYLGNNKTKVVFMHNEILEKPKNMVIDHINGNGLDNRLSNIRVCTQSQNMLNINKHKDNKSGHKGIYFCKNVNKWRAQITIPNIGNKHIGLFNDLEEAIKAYSKAKAKFHKEYAR